MAKPTAQQCHALTTYYMGKYEEVVGRAALVNRNKSRWGFESILMDYTPGQARELIDYYLAHWDTPNVEWFLYNYEKVDAAKMEREAQEISVQRRRQDTAKRLEEWRARWQK
jgi:hypothetical protein